MHGSRKTIGGMRSSGTILPRSLLPGAAFNRNLAGGSAVAKLDLGLGDPLFMLVLFALRGLEIFNQSGEHFLNTGHIVVCHEEFQPSYHLRI